MKNAESKNRYSMRYEMDETWTVYDIFTGQPADLTVGLADKLVDALNQQYIDSRNRPSH